MYEKIITLNGTQYNLSSESPITPELEKLTIQKLKIEKLTATCPTTSKLVGSTITLKCTPIAGIPPFTVKFLKNGTQLTQFTSVALNSEVTTTNVATSSDATAGSATYSTTVTDNCTDPSPQTKTETCTVIIKTCDPLQITFTLS